MKNFNTILILLGILSASILLVESIIQSQQAFVYIWRSSSTFMLSTVSIITGIALGYGLRGKLGEKHITEDDDYSF